MTGKGIDRRRVIDRNAPPRVVLTDGAGFIGSPLAGSSDYQSGASGHLYEVEAQRGFFGSLVTPGERSKLISRIILALGHSDEWAIPPQKAAIARSWGILRNVHQNARGTG